MLGAGAAGLPALPLHGDDVPGGGLQTRGRLHLGVQLPPLLPGGLADYLAGAGSEAQSQHTGHRGHNIQMSHNVTTINCLKF